MSFEDEFQLLCVADCKVLVDVHLFGYLPALASSLHVEAVFNCKHDSVYLGHLVLLGSERAAHLYLVEQHCFKRYSH